MQDLYGEALAIAREAHTGQKRKGHGGPYLAHPLFVAGFISHYGGNQFAIAAGLLHDVFEDAPYDATDDVAKLGKEIFSIVIEVTKSPDLKEYPKSKQLEMYAYQIKNMSNEAALVTACDKLHNMLDLTHTVKKYGRGVLEDFNKPKLLILEYFDKVTKTLLEREDLSDTLKVDLQKALKQLGRTL